MASGDFHATKACSTGVARRAIDSAAAHVVAGRYAEALRVIHGAMEMAPDDPELVFCRGSILFEWGRFWEARADLLSAEQAGSRPCLYPQLGWTHLWTGDVAASANWMRKAVDSDPDNWQVHFGLGPRCRARTEQTRPSFVINAPSNVHPTILNVVQVGGLHDCAAAIRRRAGLC